jgi:hypothetical protein
MSVDQRYTTIKVLIQSGHIKSFRDIFNYIPKTVVYKDLRVNFNRFSKAVNDPAGLSLAELRTLAEFFEVDTKKLIDMAFEQMTSAGKTKRRR